MKLSSIALYTSSVSVNFIFEYITVYLLFQEELSSSFTGKCSLLDMKNQVGLSI